jgi:GMP synthase (glutamine-hydrolysing)
MKKILIISVCKENLHEFEFVNPILDILRKGFIVEVKNYLEIKKKDIEDIDKIIICGTSLQDNRFIDDLDKFEFLKDFSGSIFGICSGMQILGLLFGGKLKKRTEIGFYEEDFKKDFLGLEGKQEVYHLHNNYVDFSKTIDFEIFAKSFDGKIVQAVKHKNKKIYGVLFHPEVRQKQMILEFCKNG